MTLRFFGLCAGLKKTMGNVTDTSLFCKCAQLSVAPENHKFSFVGVYLENMKLCTKMLNRCPYDQSKSEGFVLTAKKHGGVFCILDRI